MRTRAKGNRRQARRRDGSAWTGWSLVGRIGSATGGSPIAIVRSDPALGNAISTVDNADVPDGPDHQCSTLAEEGMHGPVRTVRAPEPRPSQSARARVRAVPDRCGRGAPSLPSRTGVRALVLL